MKQINWRCRMRYHPIAHRVCVCVDDSNGSISETFERFEYNKYARQNFNKKKRKNIHTARVEKNRREIWRNKGRIIGTHIKNQHLHHRRAARIDFIRNLWIQWKDHKQHHTNGMICNFHTNMYSLLATREIDFSFISSHVFTVIAVGWFGSMYVFIYAMEKTSIRKKKKKRQCTFFSRWISENCVYKLHLIQSHQIVFGGPFSNGSQ